MAIVRRIYFMFISVCSAQSQFGSILCPVCY